MSKILVGCAAVAGLAAIYLSSRFASGFALRQGPLPFHYPLGAIAAFVVTGGCLMLAVTACPALFWPLLVGTGVVTGGMFVLGYPIFDEWLAGCLILGAFAAVSQRLIPIRTNGFRRVWVGLFLLLAAYLLMEGLRGLLLYHNLKTVRSILDMAVVLSIAVLLVKYRFPTPTAHGVTVLLSACGAVYFSLYLLHGYVFRDLVYGRLILEGIGGAGKAYATFPAAVTAPAAMLLIQSNSGPDRLLAWLAIVPIFVVSVLSGARSGLFAVLLCLAIVMVHGRIKRTVELSVGLATTLIVLSVIFQFSPDFFGRRVQAMGTAVGIHGGALETCIEPGAEGVTAVRRIARLAPGEAPVASHCGSAANGKPRTVMLPVGDSQRNILNMAAFDTLGHARLGSLLLGTGTYGYWPEAGRFVAQLQARYHVPVGARFYGSTLQPGRTEPPRPPAWPVFVAETGTVGVLLILANALAAVLSAFRKSPSHVRSPLRRAPVLAVASLLLLLGWGAFAEIQDSILLYLILMPYGVVDTWGAPAERGPTGDAQADDAPRRGSRPESTEEDAT